MMMSRQSSQAGGWTISAQGVSMLASLVAIVVAVAKPIEYVSDLRVAVERLAEATARIDSAVQRQEARVRAIERQETGLSELLEAARAARDAEQQHLRAACPGKGATR